MSIQAPGGPRAAHPWIGLLLFLLACLAVGGAGGWVTSEAVTTWYPTLRKPEWTPPSWLFGPVWTTLYLMMGTAAWRSWRSRSSQGARSALSLFGVQLALNLLWSVLFFGLRSPGAAFFELVLLWLAILATIMQFRRLDPAAAWLMVPYLAWVSFAGALNFAIWRLN